MEGGKIAEVGGQRPDGDPARHGVYSPLWLSGP